MSDAVVEGPYLSDLLAQPAAVRATLAGLKAAPGMPLRAHGFRLVVLTGMGASYHALIPLQRALLRAGVTAFAMETSELLPLCKALLREDVLLVAVSQSGRSAETVRLLEEARGRAFCVGVTNDPASPLGQRADTLVELQAGSETSVSCKTYVATLAALDWLGSVLLEDETRSGSEDWQAIAGWMESYLSEWRGHVAHIMDECRGAAAVAVVGRRDSLATAGTGALILKEAARLHAEGMSSAAFRHGPIEAVSPSHLTVIVEGSAAVSELHQRLAMDIRRAGGRAVLLSARSADPAYRLPAVAGAAAAAAEILPVQMMTLAFAALSGIEAGRFRHASKVTVVE